MTSKRTGVSPSVWKAYDRLLRSEGLGTRPKRTDALAHAIDLTEDEHNRLMGLDDLQDDYSEESMP